MLSITHQPHTAQRHGRDPYELIPHPFLYFLGLTNVNTHLPGVDAPLPGVDAPGSGLTRPLAGPGLARGRDSFGLRMTPVRHSL